MKKPVKIKSPAIKVGGKVFTGSNHGIAMKKAEKAGKSLKGFSRERDGKFLLTNGKLISRAQSQKQFGVKYSHQLKKYGKS